MEFTGESLQAKVLKFFIKFKKIIIFCVLGAFLFQIIYTAQKAETKKQRLKLMEEIYVCRNLEKEKKYQDCDRKLQEIRTQYSKFVVKDNKMKMWFDLYHYKITLLNNNPKDLEERILNNKYISQWYEYPNFSIAGEFLLVHKMMIFYNKMEYQQCIDIYMNEKMQKLPHFIAVIIKANALIALGKNVEAIDFLNQVFLYNYDYTQDQLKGIVKNFLFNIQTS